MVWKARNERRLLEAARKGGEEHRWWNDLSDGLKSKQIRPQDFRIRELFESFVDDGHEAVQAWSPQSGGGQSFALIESGVDTAAFANITGQIVYSELLDAFEDPAFIGDSLVTTVPTQFSGEKIPGIGRIGDDAETVGENDPYPMAGVSEEWIDTPETYKRGFIVPVTKEAIFFDRTGIILDRAREVGAWLGVNKEKRILDTVLGITTSYRRNGGSAIATYGDNSGSHDWDNLAASNALVDWTDIEAAELLFDGMTDPNTGEPIMVQPDTVIVPSALKWTAQRVLSATEVREVTNTNTTTLSGNPLAGQSYRIATSQYVKNRTSSATTWFFGQPTRAFAYMQNWPITSVTAPPNSDKEFSHDIVQQFKVSERGAAAVREPRRMVKCTA